mgnify:CR=1 FL=1
MDHDRLFKELLRTFFFEFLELFFPALTGCIDRCQAPIFLDKESFGQSKRRREVDLVVRLKMNGQETHFLVHVEHQAQARGGFPGRMHRYFSRLLERYGHPVYPIALFSFDRPLTKQPDRYQMTVAGRRVLDFRYAALQLNRMNWCHFARQANPVASALMARMNIAPRERARVKLQCLRLLATLALDRKKSHLISDFVDSYLQLDPAEVRIFKRSLEKLPQDERQEIMQITNSWKEEGRIEGLAEGRSKGRNEGLVEGLLEGLETALELKFGPPARPLILRMQNYSLDALQELRRKLLDGAQLDEL